MSNENLKDDHLSQSLSYCLEERNEEVKKLNKDIENLTEENNALKFSNQLWLQRVYFIQVYKNAYYYLDGRNERKISNNATRCS